MTSTILVFTLSDPVCTSNEMILPKLLVHPSITFTCKPIYKVPFETKKNVLGEKNKNVQAHTHNLPAFFSPCFFLRSQSVQHLVVLGPMTSPSHVDVCLCNDFIHLEVQAMKIMTTCPRFLYQGHHLEVWITPPRSLTHITPLKKLLGPQ